MDYEEYKGLYKNIDKKNQFENIHEWYKETAEDIMRKQKLFYDEICSLDESHNVDDATIAKISLLLGDCIIIPKDKLK